MNSVDAPGSARLVEEVRAIYGFIYGRVGASRDAAEELTQEVLSAALEGRYEPARGPLRAWLMGIALRKIADRQRRTAKSRVRLPELARDLSARLRHEPLPPDRLEREETRAIVNQALAKLPPTTSALLVEKYFYDRPVAELAAERSVSESALESQLTRAREAFEVAIGRAFETEET